MHLLQWLYMVLVFGGGPAFVVLIRDHLWHAHYVSWWHVPLFPFVYVGMIIFYWKICTSDPGKIEHHHLEALNELYAYDNVIYSPKVCSTCEFVAPARSKHCSACGMHVARVDHHCPWIGNCVGLKNMRLFLTFVMTTAVYIGYGIFAGMSILFGTVYDEQLWAYAAQQHPNQDFTSLKKRWITVMFGETILIGATFMFAILCLGVLILWGTIAYAVTVNHSIYEMIRVKRKKAEPTSQDTPFKYNNIYNKGWIRNWKEVLFPIKLESAQKPKDSTLKSKGKPSQPDDATLKKIKKNK
jgi:hypothetical protein